MDVFAGEGMEDGEEALCLYLAVVGGEELLDMVQLGSLEIAVGISEGVDEQQHAHLDVFLWVGLVGTKVSYSFVKFVDPIAAETQSIASHKDGGKPKSGSPDGDVE